MDILEALGGKQHFTAAEAVIADYILGHLDRAASLSANGIAMETMYSSSSVTRLCQKLGFSGYRAFQMELLSYVLERQMASHPPRQEGTPQNPAGTAGLDELPLVMVRAVENCQLWISDQSLRRAAHWIAQAKRVGLYGPDFAAVPGLCRELLGMGIAAFPSDFFSDASYDTCRLEGGDAALVAACHPFPVLHDRLAGFRSQGIRVILITTESVCPEADLLLQLPKAGTGEAETLYRQTALLYLSCRVSRLVRGELRCPDRLGNAAP